MICIGHHNTDSHNTDSHNAGSHTVIQTRMMQVHIHVCLASGCIIKSIIIDIMGVCLDVTLAKVVIAYLYSTIDSLHSIAQITVLA